MGKTLLLLGGTRYALPVIDAAHDLGVRVVTCDYLPKNYAHRFSDSYLNASVTDETAVVEAAKRVGADGIMSFATDPGVVSAAYAAEKLGLPFQGSLEAVSVLQDKERFRLFLRDNGFNCPELFVFASADDAGKAAEGLPYPVITKPVDSAGSKGVTKVDSPDNLHAAVDYALSFSKSGRCIVEQFLEKTGDSSDADGFAVSGKLRCVSFTSQLFDPRMPNPYTPAAYTMPASMPEQAQVEIVSELQRLVDLLELRDGVFNIETRVASDGKPYIMEVSPRGGGNRLCEMLRLASDVDLVRASVQAALGISLQEVGMPKYDGFWYQQILHSGKRGVFQGIEYVPGFREEHVIEEQLWVASGERVEAFTAANFAFGSLMMRFESQEELSAFRSKPSRFMEVKVV